MSRHSSLRLRSDLWAIEFSFQSSPSEFRGFSAVCRDRMARPRKSRNCVLVTACVSPVTFCSSRGPNLHAGGLGESSQAKRSWSCWTPWGCAPDLRATCRFSRLGTWRCVSGPVRRYPPALTMAPKPFRRPKREMRHVGAHGKGLDPLPAMLGEALAGPVAPVAPGAAEP